MKPYWKIAVVSLLIGWLLGATSGLLFLRERPLRSRPSPERMAERFSRQLKLTPEQERRVRDIVADRRLKMNGIRQAAQLEIRTMLTPQQQAEFDQIHARRERRRWKN